MAIQSSSTCPQPKKTKQTFHSPLSTEDSHQLPNLPPEIIVDILSRLPVKSLLRFRCVSKSWRSLISQPEFAKTHLSLASVNTDYTHHRLILQDEHSYGQSPRIDVKSCSLYSIWNEQSDTAVDLDRPLKSKSLVMIVGCCDGLVCLAIGQEIVIWNPSTRKSKILPEVVVSPYHFITMYGFCYDESIDDYKVVVFSYDFYCRGFENEGNVYSLRTNSWRRIGAFPRCIFRTDASGTYLNRALHWTVNRESNFIIVSLDLSMESYGEVLLPDYGNGYLGRSSLDVLNGCLRVVSAYDEYVDVWVMKEYGIRESWTKLIVIPYGTRALRGPYPTFPTPVCILKNGEVLVSVNTNLVRYNPKDGTTFYLPIRNCLEQFTVYRCIESLISPDTD